MEKTKKSIIIGIIASLILISIYFVILTIANSFNHAIEQLMSLWYWILILTIGFGIQVGLYSYIRSSLREKLTAATAEVAAAGGISTGSMIACCAHHVTDILPIIGLSAAALFLVKYQTPFMLLGIFSNLVGITMMLSIIQEHKLYQKKSIFKTMFNYSMKTIRNIVIVLSVVIISFSFLSAAFKTTDTDITKATNDIVGFDLPAKENDENGVSIEAKPIDFSFDKQIKFDIAINTHQGSLDFDMTKISVLEDDKGNKYQPLTWQGSEPGGHHRYGVLTFPELNQDTLYIKLTVKDVYGVAERIFSWELDALEE